MVEIIPKPVQRTPLWQNVLFYFSLFLLVVAVIAYFGLVYLEKRSSQDIKDLDKAIAAKWTQKDKSLETEVIDDKKKIQDFSFLLSRHRKAPKFFSSFEKMIHPKVWFSVFNLNLEKSSVTVSGSTDSFWSLGQQLLIFKRQPLVKQIKLSGVSIATEGGVRFTFNILFSPQIFK